MHHAYIDKFARGSSPVHHLNAGVKLLAVLAYTVVLIGIDRRHLAPLAPLAVWPLAMLMLGGIPIRFALRRVLILSPFILTVCLFQPVFLRQAMKVELGPWRFSIAGGWIVAANLAGKFALGVLALTALMGTTPFSSLLAAMRRVRVPTMLVMMLGFLYRYLFVLIDEAMRIRRGRDFRGASLAPVGRRLAAVGGVIGSLFIRTMERSRRIHLAMTARGFDGTAHALEHPHLHLADGVFAGITAVYLGLCCLLAHVGAGP